MIIHVSADGKLTFVYDDDCAELLREGNAQVTRASRIEPWGQQGGEWFAEIYGGPTLGPFALRREAIAAEVAWIEGNLLGREANE